MLKGMLSQAAAAYRSARECAGRIKVDSIDWRAGKGETCDVLCAVVCARCVYFVCCICCDICVYCMCLLNVCVQYDHMFSFQFMTLNYFLVIFTDVAAYLLVSLDLKIQQTEESLAARKARGCLCFW